MFRNNRTFQYSTEKYVAKSRSFMKYSCQVYKTDKHQIMPRKHLISPEQPSFELPSLPPWRTPRIKILNNTPLRRGPPADANAFGTPDKDQAFMSEKDPDIYDYFPLSNKRLLTESRINQLLQSETAAHCLVFHKDKHDEQEPGYRPDLDIWCCDSSDEEIPTSAEHILLSVPEAISRDTTLILARRDGLQRPNVRRADDLLQQETKALERFWDNTELTSTLNRHQMHDQFLILQQEQDEIEKSKRELLLNDSISDVDNLDSYKWLKDYCRDIWERDSWMYEAK